MKIRFFGLWITVMVMAMLLSTDVSASTDKNDSPSAATSILVNRSYGGYIEDNADEDWYRFTLDTPGYIWVDFNHAASASAVKCWQVSIRNSNGVMIATDNEKQYEYAGKQTR